MNGNVCYQHKFRLPEGAKADVKALRDTGALKGKIVIEEDGGSTIGIECEDLADALILKLTF